MQADDNRQKQHLGRIHLALLLTATVIILGRFMSVGGFRWSDAAVHAMNGVFVQDLLRYLPVSDPLGFAVWQYAHYPALGLIGYYPPFFAVVEAGFFAVFGISVTVARLTVVCFGLLAVSSAYGVLRRLLDRWTAFVAVLFFIVSPLIVFWSRQVMLEMPTIAMMLLSAWFFLRFFETPSWVNILGCTLAGVAATLTKQTAIFIFAVFALEVLCRRAWWVFRAKKFWFSLVLAAVFLVPYSLLTEEFAPLLKYLVTYGKSSGYLLSPRTWSFYLYNFPVMFGGGLTALMGVGAVLLVSRKLEWAKMRFMMLWLVIGYLMCTYIIHKELRYFFFVTPPLFLLAGYGLVELVRRFPSRRIALVLGLIVVGIIFIEGYSEGDSESYYDQTWIMPDYDCAARMLTADPDARIILFEGKRDGQFVFSMRRHEQEPGKHLIVRASKVLYSCASDRRWYFREHVTDKEGVLRVLANLGIDHVVIESKDLFSGGTRPGAFLRELVKEEPFKLIARLPIVTNRQEYKGVTLDVYKIKGRTRDANGSIKIPLPVMGKTIIIPLPEVLGRFKPGFEWDWEETQTPISPPGNPAE
jgi:hypothetical protein